MSKSKRGIPKSAETIEKIKKNHADVSGKNNPMYGIRNKAKRVICEHCGKDIAINIYYQFHGKKCKYQKR